MTTGNKNFLNRYIDEELYIQNRPLSEARFIEYCVELGFSAREIKDNMPPALLVFKKDERVQEFLCKSFGNIMDIRSPLKKLDLEKNINSPMFDDTQVKDAKGTKYYSPFQFILVDRLTRNLNIDQADTINFLKLTVYLQNVYIPFFRSGGKDITLEGDDLRWTDRRRNINFAEVLEKSGVDEQFLLKWYKNLVELGSPLLGGKKSQGSDWLELWKNISWSKKNALRGEIRRGVEYIQWALMFKTIIQDYAEQEILDIDEISNIAAEDILKFEPSKMDQKGILLRASRNHFFTDPASGINYYHDKYRRLNYLANSFGLEYQPKVILFVEGDSEEKLLPKIFEWYRGLPGFFGVQIVNLEGVDSLRSTHDSAVELRRLINELHQSLRTEVVRKADTRKLNRLIQKLKKVDIVLSNWESFINFNLEKWQAIPFFLADNEGRLQTILQESKILKFENERYDVPREWQYLWGIANENNPLVGNSFELANFNNDEICAAILDVYGTNVSLQEIEDLRIEGEALGKITEKLNNSSPSSKHNKMEVTERLVSNLLEEYKNEEPPARPIFEAIDKILRIASLNHAPTTTLNEMDNRKAILEQITRGDKK